jgi:TolB-like protein
MLRQKSYATRMFAAAAAAATVALPAVSVAQDNRPVVVVFQFDNNSIGATSTEYAGVRSGIQDLLITDLASNAKIRIVDRAHLNEVMTEQQLAKDGKVDQTTAVRVGKVLGAQYAITGGFMSDGRGNVVLTGRTIDIETTQIGTPTRINGKTDNVLATITELSTKVSSNMNLAPKPGVGRGDGGDASKGKPAQSGATTYGSSTYGTAPATSGYGAKTNPATSGSAAKTAPATTTASNIELWAKPTTKPDALKVKLDAPALKLYSQALDAMDAKDNPKAIALFKQVLDRFQGFEPAERNLKKLGAA